MITLYKGDDTGGQLGKNVKIVFHCDDAVDMDDVVVKFDLLGIVKREFTDVHDGDILDIFISHAESRKFPLGVIFAKMWGEDASGKLRTFANRIPFRVTLNLIAVYGSDGTDSQDIHVYSSVDWDSIANKPTVFPSSVEEVEGLQEALDDINGKIPEDASVDNQLADKEWVDQEIDRVAAYYITSDAQGNPFQTRAALLNAETYYSGGSPRTPTRNDYAIVLADETHDNTEYRYIYSVNEQGVGTWEAQYPVEGVMTVDQSVTKDSPNPVSGGGVWSALWGMATTAFSSVYDWCVAQLAIKRDYTDRSYNTQVTVNAPALHAILTSRGTQLLEYYLPCTEDIPATPEINHVYTWRRDGAEFYITQGVSALTTIWTLYDSAGEQLARTTTDNATQGYFPDLTFETSAYAAVTSTNVNSYPDEVQDSLALDSNVPAASTSLPKMDSPNAAVIGTPGKYACSDHVHPSDTSRVPTSRTVNGKALTDDVTLTGADIAVSGSDATKISAALAGKATKADATLAERGFSEWNVVCSDPTVHGFIIYDGDNQKYQLYDSNDTYFLFDETEAIWPEDSATSLQFSYADADLTFVATRTALPGYQLGSQSTKPLASEAEAEALRQGKLDKGSEYWNVSYTNDGLRIADAAGAFYIDIAPNRVKTNFPDAAHEVSWPINGGTLALLQDLAPAFSTSATYALKALCIYERKLYRCTTAVTTAGAWTGSANWTLATVEDVLEALRTAIAGKANASDLLAKLDSTSAAPAFSTSSTYEVGDHVTYNGALYRCTTAVTTAGAWDASKWTSDMASNYFQYALTTKTIENGAVTLDDRAMNAVAVSSSLASLTINFPTATSGKVRDFGLRLSVASGVTTAPELVLPQGVVCENADGEVPEIGADGAATILYFTETASGVFLVKGDVVTAIS